ncbi:MAG: hypothetical protein FWE19_00640 [Oscillospiraceae bacterium]|nr:hypothetical protein [Oscillospiraceae bacterium]
MYDYAYRVYESVIAATSSELVLFFVIAAVVLAVVVAPLYIAVLKDRKEARKCEREREEKANEHQREREKLILGVVDRNSTAFEGLRTTLENAGSKSEKAHDEIISKVNKILTAVSGGNKQ